MQARESSEAFLVERFLLHLAKHQRFDNENTVGQIDLLSGAEKPHHVNQPNTVDVSLRERKEVRGHQCSSSSHR